MSAGPVHLVDDDADVRKTLARLPHSVRYAVREYGSGEDLLASAGSHYSGCILHDIRMPGQDGFAVCRTLAEKSVTLPIVMMTGSGGPTVLALKAGAADIVQKPFGRGELLSVLEQLSTKACDA